jgi:hypothetical protein
MVLKEVVASQLVQTSQLELTWELNLLDGKLCKK